MKTLHSVSATVMDGGTFQSSACSQPVTYGNILWGLRVEEEQMVHEASVSEGDNSQRKLRHRTDV